MQKRIFWAKILLFLAGCLFVAGFFSGQEAVKKLPQPAAVFTEAENVNPGTQQLIEELKYYRKAGDAENAAQILAKLSPAGLLVPEDDSVKTEVAALDQGAVETTIPQWLGTDTAVLSNATDHEKWPDMDIRRGISLTPEIFLVAEKWNGTSGPKSIHLTKSFNHGQIWGSISSYWYNPTAGPYSRPRIHQTSSGTVGIVYEIQASPSNYNIGFSRFLAADLGSPSHKTLENSADHCVRPALVSDYHMYPTTPFAYLVYYRIIGTSGELLFTVSTDLGNTWSAAQTIATFTAPGEPHCSIDFDADRLYVAFTLGQGSGDNVAVMRSTDFGGSWTTPLVIANDTAQDDRFPEVAVSGSTYACVAYEYTFAPGDRDIFYSFTPDGGATWYIYNFFAVTGNDERYPSIEAFKFASPDEVYASYVSLPSSVVVRKTTTADPTSWPSELTPKNSAANLSSDGRAQVLPKYRPDGTPGVAVAWSEGAANLDIYFDSEWLGTVNPASVSTASVTGITATTAACGGDVTSDGGNAVTERGVCWAQYSGPTTTFYHTHDGTGTGAFTSSLTGLTPGTTYYARAYAVNAAGTIYGNEATFSTLAPKLNAPTLSSPADGASGQPTSLNLQWIDTNSSPQEVGYRIRVKPAGGIYTYSTTAADAVTYPLSGLANSTTYYWNVQAMGSGAALLDSDWANSDVDRSFRTTSGVTVKLFSDFGSLGLWLLDNTSWSQLSGVNPESVVAANVDADASVEAAVDFGALGLWLWNDGAWSQLTGVNPEQMTAGDTDNDSFDEIVVDFGGLGIWTWDGGAWGQISPSNPQYLMTANTDADPAREVCADFGSLGIWLWDNNVWGQISADDPDYLIPAEIDADGREEIVGDLGSKGLWVWDNSSWSQISPSNPENMIAADKDGDGSREIIGDFGTLGLFLWDGSAWSQLSSINPDRMVAAQSDIDSAEEIVVDFDSVGLWLWDNGSWSQMSGANAETLAAADGDGDAVDETFGDFGSLGLWSWSEGNWTQLSGVNPESMTPAKRG